MVLSHLTQIFEFAYPKEEKWRIGARHNRGDRDPVLYSFPLPFLLLFLFDLLDPLYSTFHLVAAGNFLLGKSNHDTPRKTALWWLSVVIRIKLLPVLVNSPALKNIRPNVNIHFNKGWQIDFVFLRNWVTNRIGERAVRDNSSSNGTGTVMLPKVSLCEFFLFWSLFSFLFIGKYRLYFLLHLDVLSSRWATLTERASINSCILIPSEDWD